MTKETEIESFNGVEPVIDDSPDRESKPENDSLTHSESRKNSALAGELETIIAFGKPQQPLEDELLRQREEERKMFDDLIQENVKVERERRKMEDKLQEATAKNAVLTVEVEKQKDDMNELHFKIASLESVSQKTTHEESGPNQSGEEANEGEKRIRDLQFRLLRITSDMEEQDQRIKEMEEERGELQKLVVELEKHTGQSKVEEIHRQLEAEKANRKRDEDDNRRANVVRQGGVQRSAMCNVM